MGARARGRAREGADASDPNRYPHSINGWRKRKSRRRLRDGEGVLAGPHGSDHSASPGMDRGGMSPCAAVRTDRGRPRGGDAPSPTRIDSKLEMRVDCGGANG